MFEQLMSKRKDRTLEKQITLFVRREDRDFVEALRIFVKLKYPTKTLNWFLFICLKHVINSMLTPTQLVLLKDIYYEIAGEELPGNPPELKTLNSLKRRNAKNRKKSNS